MEHVALADLADVPGPADVKRRLTGPLGTESMALSYYELAPGDSFAFGYHAHDDQEEVFYVASGTATFRTADGPVDVAAGEAVRFEPGEYQRGVNRGEERVVALAVGAPRESGDTDVRRQCPDCEAETSQAVERADDGAALVTRCLDCGARTGRFE